MFKRNSTPTFKKAVSDYREASGALFVTPSEQHSVFEKDAWILNDETGELVCIVGNQGPVFGKGIAVQMQKLAESFAG